MSKKKHVHIGVTALFLEAEKRPSFATRYVHIARTLAMKHTFRIPTLFKRRYCKHCYAYFGADTSHTRIKKGRIIRTCHACNKQTRYPLS